VLGKGVTLLKYSLKLGQRQDIVKFPHHIHNHVHVKFVMGHGCPFQCISLQSLCRTSTVSAKATCTIRTEVLESRAVESPIVSELQTETEAEISEVSSKTAKKRGWRSNKGGPTLEPSRKQEERKTEKQLEKIGNQGSG
jgi:hypothetical protein